MKTVGIGILLVAFTASASAQQPNAASKCGPPKVKAEDDSAGRRDRIKDIDQRLSCYAGVVVALEAERDRLAAANAQLSIVAKPPLTTTSTISEPLHTSITGHAFNRNHFSPNACVQKAKDYVKETGGSIITVDESSVTYGIESNVVVVECNGWLSNVTVSGHNSSTRDLAQRIDMTLFPKGGN